MFFLPHVIAFASFGPDQASMGQTSTDAQPASGLDNREWVLQSYGDPDNPTSTLPGTRVTAQFDSSAGRVAGSAGCNRYNGLYQLNGNRLSLSRMVSTRMYCPGPGVMQQEAAYLQALQTVESYDVQGDRLLINSAGNTVLTYSAATPDVPTSAEPAVSESESGPSPSGELF
jgi:heat shock protein HslJ